MPAPKALLQFKMPAEIRKIVVDRKFAAPTLANINRALTRIYEREPERFSSESSRAVLVQDVAGGFIERNERAKRNQGEKRSPKGDTTSYPLGYEYSVLAAVQIRPELEWARERFWKSKEPLASFEAGVKWIDTCHKIDLLNFEENPIKVKLEIELTSDKEAIDTLGPRTILYNKGSGEADPIRFETWLKNIDEKLRNAVLNKVYHGIRTGPTLKLAPPNTSMVTQLGATVIPRGFNDADVSEWLTVDGGFLAQTVEFFGTLAEAKAPGWTADDVFSYFLFGYLPAMPMSAETHHTNGKAYGFSYTFAHPVQERKVLEAHRRNLKAHRDSKLLHYSLEPKELSEYDLNLLELVYKMPEEDFTWSQRLETYRKLFAKDIATGLSPDLGLTDEREIVDKNKWNNA